MSIIAITGASGFVGSALAAFLRARGDRVRPMVRPGRRAEDGIAWDPAGGQVDEAALAEVDAIVHLAGENVGDGRWTAAKKQRIRDSRVDGTSLLAGALARMAKRPAVWVSGSAVGFYGDRGDARVDESASMGNDFLAEVTRAWEAAAAPARAVGVRVVHPRMGLVLAPHGGALAKMLLPFKLGLGGKLGSGTQGMSWIALNDAVRALVHLVDTAALEGPVNVTAPEPVTNAAFTRALGEALHRPTALTVPAPIAKLALGEMAQVALLSGVCALPRKLLDSGFRFTHPELGAYLAQTL
ncbi:MAG: TIGR01777 family oxidoreductase [Polyangiales bacterium]